MINVISIVEGDGEVAAVPVLLRRIGQWLTPQILVNISKPIRVRRDQFLQRDDVFRKQLMVASALCQAPGWILILLDADDDCPQELANEIHAKAKSILPEREISVVLANREYEACLSPRRSISQGSAASSCRPISLKLILSGRRNNG